jgi:catechol 2,3-dioxygenase-like lactoylglutathione lyase family enzyme
MDWKLEVVLVPVSDVTRAKEFYADRLGFVVDLDTDVGPGVRIVQLTPPGSGCSVTLSSGLHDAVPGSAAGLQLVVDDIDAAHAELTGRGADVSEVYHWVGSERHPGRGGDWNSFLSFYDPDGNPWTVQERPRAR